MKDPKDWRSIDNQIKNLSFLSLSVVLCLATILAGPNTAYVLIGISAVCYGVYNPKDIEQWFSRNHSSLLGATAGFFLGGLTFPALAPIGLMLGAWTGHFSGKTYQGAVEKVKKVTAPIAYASKKTNDFWDNVKSGYERVFEYLAEDTPEKKPTRVRKPLPKPVKPSGTRLRQALALQSLAPPGATRKRKSALEVLSGKDNLEIQESISDESKEPQPPSTPQPSVAPTKAESTASYVWSQFIAFFSRSTEPLPTASSVEQTPTVNFQHAASQNVQPETSQEQIQRSSNSVRITPKAR